MSASIRNSEGYADLTAKRAIDRADKAISILRKTEAQEQIALFEWAVWNEKKWPELALLHHVPNGGSRHKAEARNLKRQGVKPGVPDIHLPVARREYHGLYIELKAAGGRITENQAWWLNELKRQGHFAVVAYGFDDAREYIEWYLN